MSFKNNNFIISTIKKYKVANNLLLSNNIKYGHINCIIPLALF